MLRSLQPDHRCRHLASELRGVFTLQHKIPTVGSRRLNQIKSVHLTKCQGRLLKQFTFWIQNNCRAPTSNLPEHSHQERLGLSRPCWSKNYNVPQPLDLWEH